MKKRKHKRLLIAVIIILAIFAFIASSEEEQKFSSPIIEKWYDVEDWEIQACNAWGGKAEATDYYGTPLDFGKEHGVTYTVQALKFTVGNSTIYEASYFVRPEQGKVEVQVRYVTDKGQEYAVDQGAAKAKKGFSGYYALETNKLGIIYEKVIVDYEVGEMEAEFIEKLY